VKIFKIKDVFLDLKLFLEK